MYHLFIHFNFNLSPKKSNYDNGLNTDFKIYSQIHAHSLYLYVKFYIVCLKLKYSE